MSYRHAKIEHKTHVILIFTFVGWRGGNECFWLPKLKTVKQALKLQSSIIFYEISQTC